MRKGLGTVILAGVVLLVGPSMGFTLRGFSSLPAGTSSLIGLGFLLFAGGIYLFDSSKDKNE